MVSSINKQLLLTAYAYLYIMGQQGAQQGSDAIQMKPSVSEMEVTALTPHKDEAPFDVEQKVLNFCGGKDAQLVKVAVVSAFKEMGARERIFPQVDVSKHLGEQPGSEGVAALLGRTMLFGPKHPESYFEGEEGKLAEAHVDDLVTTAQKAADAFLAAAESSVLRNPLYAEDVGGWEMMNQVPTNRGVFCSYKNPSLSAKEYLEFKVKSGANFEQARNSLKEKMQKQAELRRSILNNATTTEQIFKHFGLRNSANEGLLEFYSAIFNLKREQPQQQTGAQKSGQPPQTLYQPQHQQQKNPQSAKASQTLYQPPQQQQQTNSGRH